jgi:Rho-type GTPase-activating protein 1/2
MQADLGEDEFFIPMALDPNPVPGPSPMARSKKYSDESVPKSGDSRGGRDYFNTVRPSQTSSHRDVLRDNQTGSSRSSSTERSSKPAQPSPHIAYQEKGRQPSDNLTEALRKRKEPLASTSANASPNMASERTRTQHASSPSVSRSDSNQSENFKLQDVPKSKRASSRRNSKSERSPQPSSLAPEAGSRLQSSIPSSPTSAAFQPDTRSVDEHISPQIPSSTTHATSKQDLPKRGDSLAASSLKHPASRKLSDSRSSPSTPTAPTHERKASASTLHNRDGSALAQANGGLTISSPIESPTSKSILTGDVPVPPRAPGRGGPGTNKQDSFTSPRSPPAIPQHRPSDSVSSVHSDLAMSGSPPIGLLRYSGGPDFSLDADMARILGSEEAMDREPSVLRKVSNAVKHGRSFSDRGSRASGSHKHKTPGVNGSIDISSPTTASPESKDEVVELRNQLRRAQQRITELEAQKLSWQEQNSTADIRQANTELREKRSTISVLDTQREMLIRELEIMTTQIAQAKEGGRNIDAVALRNNIIKEFTLSLEKLKDSFGDSIEELVQKRQTLTDDITNLIQVKDKGMQEYDSLTIKNEQLTAMNNKLLHNIQQLYKENRQPQSKQSFEGIRTANGLGIYTQQKLDTPTISSQDTTLVNYGADVDNDPHVIRDAPAIVEVKKARGMKLATWRKGGQNAAKTISKGFKGLVSDKENRREEIPHALISHPYGSVQGGAEPVTVVPGPLRTGMEPQQRPGGGASFGFFGQRGNNLKMPQQHLRHTPSNGSNSNLEAIKAAEPPSTLFGSDLTARCEYEKRTIPGVVIKCIQEVQVRGRFVDGLKMHRSTDVFLRNGV